MVSFIKENGFPATIHIDTIDLYDMVSKTTNYRTTIRDESGNILSEFNHTDLRARIHWANGFFTALRRGVNWNLPLSIN
jgi:hypothetical protein